MTAIDVLLTLATIWLVVVGVAWLVVVPFLSSGPGLDPVNGLLWWMMRAYSRVWHRATYTGVELAPRSEDDHDGLIVVANHTGAIDPLLVQSRCGCFIRWMMAEEMMGPELDWLWRRRPIIAVSRDGRDSGPLRDAIRWVKQGGVVGIFPEGRITLPPREIRPFLPGAGFIIAKTRAPVLLVWISGTPVTNKLGECLKSRSNARVEFIERLDLSDISDPVEICERLRRRISEVSGWPLNDEVLPPGGTVEESAAAR